MIDGEIQKIQKFIDSLEHRISNAVTEKNYLIKQVNGMQDEIAAMRKELKEWTNTLEKVKQVGMDR